MINFPIELLNKNEENIYYYQHQIIRNRQMQGIIRKKWICYNIDMLHVFYKINLFTEKIDFTKSL